MFLITQFFSLIGHLNYLCMYITKKHAGAVIIVAFYFITETIEYSCWSVCLSMYMITQK